MVGGEADGVGEITPDSEEGVDEDGLVGGGIVAGFQKYFALSALFDPGEVLVVVDEVAAGVEVLGAFGCGVYRLRKRKRITRE